MLTVLPLTLFALVLSQSRRRRSTVVQGGAGLASWYLCDDQGDLPFQDERGDARVVARVGEED